MKNKLNPEWVKLGPKADLCFGTIQSPEINKKTLRKYSKMWSKESKRIRHEILLKQAKKILTTE